jgi:hypothetical protein
MLIHKLIYIWRAQRSICLLRLYVYNMYTLSLSLSLSLSLTHTHTGDERLPVGHTLFSWGVPHYEGGGGSSADVPLGLVFNRLFAWI